MNFRRIPFQFTTTDPTERQRELEKRFGIPTRNMYVDSNPRYMANGMREASSASSSPRLQHRVPIFVEGSDKPVKPAVDSQNQSDGGRKPHVRVIPIEVEGASSPHATRQRTFSGPAGFVKNGLPERELDIQEPVSPTKRSMQDVSCPNKIKSPSGPRVCNIPIQIEGRSDVRKPKNPISPQSSISNSSKKSEASKKPNGSCISKASDKSKVQHEEKPPEPNINVPLKKIENILEEFKMYKIGVENFNGTIKDKQYRYLDEMLTRCMLKLDDIDTMGNETVRLSRKAAVKQVQQCIDLLESKVSSLEGSTKEGTTLVDSQGDKNIIPNEKLEGDNQKDEEMKETVEETSNRDVEMTEVACEESKDEEMKEVASEASEKDQEMKEGASEASGKDQEMKEGSEKDQEMKDQTSNEIKEGKDEIKDKNSQVPEVEMEESDNAVCKGEEIIDLNKVPDSQVPEVEMEESENVTVNLVQTDNEVTESQLASTELSGNPCDAEMGEADAQAKQSAPVLQENTSTSQTKCKSLNASCTDTNLILNQDTSACKESTSVNNTNAKIETDFLEIVKDENTCVPSVKISEVKNMHGVDKLQSGEQIVSDLPVDDESKRTESSDCDMQNRNTSENCSEKVINKDTVLEKPEIQSEL